MSNGEENNVLVFIGIFITVVGLLLLMIRIGTMLDSKKHEHNFGNSQKY